MGLRVFRMAVWLSLVCPLMKVTAAPPSGRAEDCGRLRGDARRGCEEHLRTHRSKAPARHRSDQKPGTAAPDPTRTPGKPILDDRAHYFAGTDSSADSEKR